MNKNVIHIFWASGSGTTTLGKRICEELNFKLLDVDDYFWIPANPPFTQKRPTEERLKLIKTDVEKFQNVVISGSIVGWGDELIPYFTLAIRIEMDKSLRIERIEKREKERFGSRIEFGGDMYQQHIDFIQWAKMYDDGDNTIRSKKLHDEWQKQLSCEILCLDGANSLEQNSLKVIEKIELQKMVWYDSIEKMN